MPRNSRAAKARIGDLFRVIRGAAEIDADCGELWELIQRDFHANQRAIVESLRRDGDLRPGLTVARGTDVLWTLNHPDVWTLLVGQRGLVAAGVRDLAGTDQLRPVARDTRRVAARRGTAPAPLVG